MENRININCPKMCGLTFHSLSEMFKHYEVCKN